MWGQRVNVEFVLKWKKSHKFLCKKYLRDFKTISQKCISGFVMILRNTLTVAKVHISFLQF